MEVEGGVGIGPKGEPLLWLAPLRLRRARCTRLRCRAAQGCRRIPSCGARCRRQGQRRAGPAPALPRKLLRRVRDRSRRPQRRARVPQARALSRSARHDAEETGTSRCGSVPPRIPLGRAIVAPSCARHRARDRPRAEEFISYGMPAYRQYGMLAYFAAFKQHIGFYPPSPAMPGSCAKQRPTRVRRATFAFLRAADSARAHRPHRAASPRCESRQGEEVPRHEMLRGRGPSPSRARPARNLTHAPTGTISAATSDCSSTSSRPPRRTSPRVIAAIRAQSERLCQAVQGQRRGLCARGGRGGRRHRASARRARNECRAAHARGGSGQGQGALRVATRAKPRVASHSCSGSRRRRRPAASGSR